jgi:molybdate transport system ATP-binding protein
MTDLVIDARVRVASFELDARFVARPGVLVLFGPTASGKTLSLRLIAGLARPSAGSVRFGEQAFDDGAAYVRPEHRNIGYAPQHGALWPHRTDLEHLAAFTTDERARALLARVGLDGQGARKPAHLSGGERQRLAFARALTRSAKLLLLDEPFSALDDDARLAMGEIVHEQAAEGATVIFVTHDRAEATRLGEAFVMFRDGHTTQATAL